MTEGYLERLRPQAHRCRPGGRHRAHAGVVAGLPGRATSINGRGRWTKAHHRRAWSPRKPASGQFLVSTEQVDLARRWSSGRHRRSPVRHLHVALHRAVRRGRRHRQRRQGAHRDHRGRLLDQRAREPHRVGAALPARGRDRAHRRSAPSPCVVAALGISNAMLAAVRERRREIGVLKAIGGRDRDILRIFLVEAGVLGFVGGVLGRGRRLVHRARRRRHRQRVPGRAGPGRRAARHPHPDHRRHHLAGATAPRHPRRHAAGGPGRPPARPARRWSRYDASRAAQAIGGARARPGGARARRRRAGAARPSPPVATNAIPPAAGPPTPGTVFVALGADETLNRGLDDSLRRAWTAAGVRHHAGPVGRVRQPGHARRHRPRRASAISCPRRSSCSPRWSPSGSATATARPTPPTPAS